MDQGCGRHIFTNKIYNKGYEHLLPNSHATRLICMCVLSRSVVSDSFQSYKLYVACQSLSMGFPRQEYWSGLPFLSPGDLPNSGVKPTSPAVAGRLFTTEPPGKSQIYLIHFI